MTEQYPKASAQERAAHVVEVTKVPPVSLAPGIKTNIVCGKDLTLSFATIAPNAVGAMHSHPHEQMIYVLEGDADLILDGKSYYLKAGDTMWVPSNLEHTGAAHAAGCRFLEIFTPARKDFEEKLAQAKAAKK
jgi:quercetin dioxygenase-like cupin family protein